MIKEIRCPRCNKRLFDVTDKTVGPIICQCKCKDKIKVIFRSIKEITYKN